MTSKTPSFKSSMSRLNEIVASLEKNDLELEEAIVLFEEGLQLVHSCDGQLKDFENKVATLLESYQEVKDNG
ncbi:exodeoxyribonuclease VII small subunit [[Eubacterium] hominis]|uniref:exodeoxyribonuclease VII small subunit n=1 Tax=[Eubacterium] hominis TaxID=2764325 RepID=UPI003A4E55D4